MLDVKLVLHFVSRACQLLTLAGWHLHFCLIKCWHTHVYKKMCTETTLHRKKACLLVFLMQT